MSKPNSSTSLGLVRSWVSWGFSTLRQRPSELLVIALFGVASSSALLLLPWLGEPLSVLWATICDVVLILSVRDAANGQKPSLQLFRALFKDDRLRGDLLTLGAVFAFLRSIVVLGFDYGVLSHVSADVWEKFKSGAELPIDALPWSGMLLFVGLSILYFMATVFAGVLVADGGMKPFKAIFYSFFLCVKRARAMALVVLFLFAIGFVLAALGALVSMMTTPMLLFVLAPVVSVIVNMMTAGILWRAYQRFCGERGLAPAAPYPLN